MPPSILIRLSVFTPVPVDRFLLSTGFAEIHRPAVVPYLFSADDQPYRPYQACFRIAFIGGGAGLVVVGQRTVDQHSIRFSPWGADMG